jgi:GNAT superfamily N-acetyltransferase
MARDEIGVRPLNVALDLAWAEASLGSTLGDRMQVRRGELLDVLAFPGLVAETRGERMGLLTYRLDAEGCELVALLALESGRGIGSALLEALMRVIGDVDPIWVVTTNDNLDALRFYQRRGFGIRGVRPGAVTEARRTLKPAISLVGDHGIPIRDEIELELRLAR